MVQGKFNRPFGKTLDKSKKPGRVNSPEDDRKFLAGLRLAERLRNDRSEIRMAVMQTVAEGSTHKIAFGDFQGQGVRVVGSGERDRSLEVVFVGGNRDGRRMFVSDDQLESLEA